MAQAVFYINGFETGDASELASLGAGASIQSTTVLTGGYSFTAGTASSQTVAGLVATQSIIRHAFYIPTSIPTNPNVLVEKTSGGVNRLVCRLNTAGTLSVLDNGVTLGLTTATGTTVLAVNTKYVLEWAMDLAAAGIVKVWINGVLEISTTHTNDVSATTIGSWNLGGNAASSGLIYDDVRVDTGGVAQIGAGRCIARQGLAGTPTYNAWTKNGAATAALCWSDTPFSAATNCSDNVLNDAQTMLVAKFSASQTGHGAETINVGDTINACKVAVIAKTAIAGNLSIRRRYAGADTDVTVALTTSDAYWDTGIFTTTNANLDAAEIGGKNALIATLETIEDAWFIVDYTDLLLPQGVM